MISIIVPAYNEENNILKTITTINGIVKEEHEIIVVDDGSSDNTVKIVKSLKISGLHLISFSKNHGRGFAIRSAVSHAKGEKIIYIDADLSINPISINTLLKQLNLYPIVIGSKHLKASRLRYPFLRRILSLVYCFLVNVFFHNSVSDYQAGLKGFQKPTLMKLLNIMHANRWSWDTEIIVKAIKMGYKIKEIPIDVNEIGKTSSVRIMRDSITMFIELLKMKIR